MTRVPVIPGRGFVLFRLGPIEIAIHPSWFFIFGVLLLIVRSEFVPALVGDESRLAIPLTIAIALLFYVFVLLHELSHAVVARAHGIDARRITLFLFGGVAQIGGEAQKPAHEYRIAVAGPLASLLIAGVLAATAMRLHPGRPLEHAGVWGRFALLNLFLAAFNLIPAFPLDGGRLLRAGLWSGLRDRARATRWASNAGKAFAFILIGAGGAIATTFALSRDVGGVLSGIWPVVLGYFLFTIAGAAGRAEGGAMPRLPGEPVRPPNPPVKVGGDEGQAPQPHPGGRGRGPSLGPEAARASGDQPGDRSRDPGRGSAHP
jgi:Zn-dependent protease